jgi:hypothetical protein
LQQVVRTVVDCARRHLELEASTWPLHTWGLRVQEAALGVPMPSVQRSDAWAEAQGMRPWTAQTSWS